VFLDKVQHLTTLTGEPNGGVQKAVLASVLFCEQAADEPAVHFFHGLYHPRIHMMVEITTAYPIKIQRIISIMSVTPH
jgi:hypothetical protein